MSITSVSCTDGAIAIACGGSAPIVIPGDALRDALQQTGDRQAAAQDIIQEICTGGEISTDWVRLFIDWDSVVVEGVSIAPPPPAEEEAE